MNVKNIWRLAKAGCLILALTCMVVTGAFGQGRGLDVFKATRMFNLGVTNTVASGSASSVTNYVIQDIHGMDGISTIFLFSNTNSGAAAGTNLSLTCSIYLSPDQTNWNILTNYAVITSNTLFTVTNGYYGGNTNYTYAVTNGLLATNHLLYPFTWTVPTGAGSGFVTPYGAVSSFSFTNGGAITISNTSTITAVGFDMGAISTQSATTTPPRYMQLVWTAGAENFYTVGGVLMTYSRQDYP